MARLSAEPSRLHLKLPLDVIQHCFTLKESSKGKNLKSLTNNGEMQLLLQRIDGGFDLLFKSEKPFFKHTGRKKKQCTKQIIDLFVSSVVCDSEDGRYESLNKSGCLAQELQDSNIFIDSTSIHQDTGILCNEKQKSSSGKSNFQENRKTFISEHEVIHKQDKSNETYFNEDTCIEDKKQVEEIDDQVMTALCNPDGSESGGDYSTTKQSVTECSNVSNPTQYMNEEKKQITDGLSETVGVDTLDEDVTHLSTTVSSCAEDGIHESVTEEQDDCDVITEGNKNNEKTPKPVTRLVCCDCANTGRNPDALTLALHVIYKHGDESWYDSICKYFGFLKFEGKKTHCTTCKQFCGSETKAGIRQHILNSHKHIDYKEVESLLKDCYKQRIIQCGKLKAADGKLQCKVCKIYYSSYKAVYKHFIKCHRKSEMSDLLKDIKGQKQKARANGWYEKDKKVTCHKCGFMFKVGKGIGHHIKLLHGNSPTILNEAETSEKYGPFFIEHVSTYSCKLCGENFSLNKIVQHLQFKHSADETFDDCMKFYTERMQHYSGITKHVSRNSVYTNRSKVCSFCQKILSAANHNKHVKTCKLNPDRIQFYHCYCGYRTECRDKHQEHKITCTRQVPETMYCEICGLACRSRATLCTHRREKHQVGIQKPVVLFTCKICSKSFWRKSSYTKHLLIHSATKDHICETCGKAFRTPSDLKKHQDTQHENKFKYHCNKCGHGMEKEKYLKSHVCGRVRRKQNSKFIPSDTDIPTDDGKTVQKNDISSKTEKLISMDTTPSSHQLPKVNITATASTAVTSESSMHRIDASDSPLTQLSSVINTVSSMSDIHCVGRLSNVSGMSEAHVPGGLPHVHLMNEVQGPRLNTSVPPKSEDSQTKSNTYIITEHQYQHQPMNIIHNRAYNISELSKPVSSGNPPSYEQLQTETNELSKPITLHSSIYANELSKPIITQSSIYANVLSKPVLVQPSMYKHTHIEPTFDYKLDLSTPMFSEVDTLSSAGGVTLPSIQGGVHRVDVFNSVGGAPLNTSHSGVERVVDVLSSMGRDVVHMGEGSIQQVNVRCNESEYYNMSVGSGLEQHNILGNSTYQ